MVVAVSMMLADTLLALSSTNVTFETLSSNGWTNSLNTGGRITAMFTAMMRAMIVNCVCAWGEG